MTRAISRPMSAAKDKSHPMRGRAMTGADIVIQVLADEGVDIVFGYSGGAILPTYDAVFRYNNDNRKADGSAPIPLIVPANEQGRRIHGRRLCPRQRQGWHGHGDVRTGRNQHRHASTRLHGRLGARCGHLWPGTDKRHWH